MPYKDPEKARQRARERYQEIKKDPFRLVKRREQQKIAMRKWRLENATAKETCKKAQRRWKEKLQRENPEKLTEIYTNGTRRWRKNHPYNYERYKQRAYEQDRQKKIDIIIVLGGKCQKCGNDDFRVLCGHHINGRNERERNDSGKWYRHPPPLNEIMLLCANCHIIEHSKLDSRGLPI